MDEAQVTSQRHQEMMRLAEYRARERARIVMWDLDVAVFFFATSLLVIILVILQIRMTFVAPIAICGLSLGWLMGRLKGRKAFKHYYDEEFSRLQQESKMASRGAAQKREKR